MEPSSTTNEDSMNGSAPGPSSGYAASNNNNNQSSNSNQSPAQHASLATCCICNANVGKKARLLPCLHVICLTCGITAMSEAKLTCQTCKTTCHMDTIKDHSLLQYLEGQNHVSKCNNCEDNAVAIYKCDQCKDLLCAECGCAHQRVKLTRDHRLIDLENSSCAVKKCPKHIKEDCSWFCVNCQQWTCSTCQLESHTNHTHKSLEEASQFHISELLKFAEEARQRLNFINRVAILASQRTVEVNQAEEMCNMTISRTLENFQRLLLERGRVLINDLKAVADNKRQFYSQIRVSSEAMENMLKQMITFVDASTNCPNRLLLNEAFQAARHAVFLIHETHEQRKSEFNVLQLPVNVQVQFPSHEISHMISRLGQIVDNKGGTTGGADHNAAPPPNQQIVNNMSAVVSNAPPIMVPNMPSSEQTAANGAKRMRRPSGKKSAAAPAGQPLNPQMQYQQQMPGPNMFPNRPVNPAQHQMAQNYPYQQQQRPNNIGSPNNNNVPQQQQTQLMSNNANVYGMVPGMQMFQSYQHQQQQFIPNAIPITTSAANQIAMTRGHVVLAHQPSIDVFSMMRQRIGGPRAARPANPMMNNANQKIHMATPQQQQHQIQQTPIVPPPLYPLHNNVAVQQALQKSGGGSGSAPPQQIASPSYSFVNPPPEAAGTPPSLANELQQSTPRTCIAKTQTPPETSGALRTNTSAPAALSEDSSPYHVRTEAISPPLPLVAAGTLPTEPLADSISPIIGGAKFPTPVAADSKSDVKTPPKTRTQSESSGHNDQECTIVFTRGKALDSASKRAAHQMKSADSKSKEEQIKQEIAHETTVPKTESPSTSAKTASKSPMPVIYRLAKKSITQKMHAESDSDHSKSNDSFPKSTQPFSTATVSPCLHTPPVPMCLSSAEGGAAESTRNDAKSSTVDNEVSTTSNNLMNRMAPTPTSVAASDDASRWEDYCSVCQNGGNLLCCEAPGCTRVFHCDHHIPAYESVPTEQFICGLCTNLENYRNKLDSIPIEQRPFSHLTSFEQKLCEKILLSLFCAADSMSFHKPVDPSLVEYYAIIKRPMDFTTIKQKLEASTDSYRRIEEFLKDVDQVFVNCSIFNKDDSPTGAEGMALRCTYLKLIERYCPQLGEFVKHDLLNLTKASKKRKRRSGSGTGLPGQDSELDSERSSSAGSSKRVC